MAKAIASKRRSYHHGNLKEEILEHSLLYIKKNGVESLSLREIAKTVGVSHSAPNKHFPKKDSLLASLIELGFIKFRESLLKGLKQEFADSRDSFLRMGREYFQFAKKNPELYKLIFTCHIENPEDYPEVKEAGNAAFSVLHESVKAMQRNQVLKPGDSLAISLLIWSMTHGYTMLILEGLLTKGPSETRKIKDSNEDEILDGMFMMIGHGILDSAHWKPDTSLFPLNILEKQNPAKV